MVLLDAHEVFCGHCLIKGLVLCVVLFAAVVSMVMFWVFLD